MEHLINRFGIEMVNFVISSVILCVLPFIVSGAGPKFAPYYDTFLDNRRSLTEIAAQTGQKSYHLAFALGVDCIPTWGGKYALDDPLVLDPIKALQSEGGEMIVAFGGALGPYLEHSCTTSEALANAYKTVMDVVGTTHLDLDIETTVNFDLMNTALAQVQQERPTTSVSFTLMVQGEDYGLTPALGVDLLKHAAKSGVKVDLVNAMAMEFWATSDDWGTAVINVGTAVVNQMKEIWPEKSEEELKKMLGLTPMIGRNFNGRVFEPEHARRLVAWANENHIGLLAFWSVERDNFNNCQVGVVSPYCSGTPQSEFEFTQIFQGFTG